MKKVILLTISLIAIVVVMLSFQKHSNGIKPFENEAKEKGDANGMMDYFNKIMCDPTTGTIDLKAYYAALAEARAHIATSRASGNLNLQWRFLGPDNIGGRTRAILFDNKTPSKVFAASVSGGLWISNNNGQSWTEWSGSDTLENMNICSLCQDRNGVIYFGTGEGLYRNFGILGGGFPGYGIWKSTDDGVTFTRLASTTPVPFDPVVSNPWSEVNRIAINPNSPDSIFAATEGGIMCSGNGGQSWAKATTLNFPLAAKDVKFSIDGKKVFVSIGGSFYYSKDGGKNFANISGKNGFPISSGILRIEIAVSPSTPNYAYATLISSYDQSVSSVVQTIDGGNNWNTIGTGTGFSSFFTNNGFDPTGDQGDYDVAMTVSPLDSNTLFLGGITLWRWTPSTGWAQISIYGSEEYYNVLHADIHSLVFDPADSKRLIIGCDGGVCQTLNPYSVNTPVLYSSLNRNYNVTQFYSITADSAGHVEGGTQDNGNNYINFKGNTPQSANIIWGGDGGCAQIALSNNQENNEAIFAQTPYGGLVRSADGGRTFSDFYDDNINTALSKVGAIFYTPFNLWENRDSIIANRANGRLVQSLFVVGFNSKEVWVTTDALNFGTSPVWFPLQLVASGNISATTISDDGNDLYVGTDNGNIYRYSGLNQMFAKKRWKYPVSGTTIEYTKWSPADSGITLTKSTYNEFVNRTILSIAVDPNNPNHVIATCGNFMTGVNSWIAQSLNAADTSIGGFTFSSIQGSGATELPKAPVYSACILHAGNGANIAVGTPLGVWTSSDMGNTWAPDNNGLANVTVMSVKELPYFNTYGLYVGTHGRGAFTTDLATGITTSFSRQTVTNLTVFPNPMSSNGHITYELLKPGKVVVSLYNIEGKLVKYIANETMNAGPVDITFNVNGLVNGTYIVEVADGENRSSRKLVIIH